MDEKRELINSDISDDDLKEYIDILMDDKIRILWDGTYLYTNNPGSIEDTVFLWSSGKKRPLLKAHIHCSSNGFIMDVRFIFL